LTEDEPLATKTTKEVVPGKKDERRPLNPKSKEWASLYGDAKAAMGGMEPSKLITAFCDIADNKSTQVLIRIIKFTVCYSPLDPDGAADR